MACSVWVYGLHYVRTYVQHTQQFSTLIWFVQGFEGQLNEENSDICSWIATESQLGCRTSCQLCFEELGHFNSPSLSLSSYSPTLKICMHGYVAPSRVEFCHIHRVPEDAGCILSLDFSTYTQQAAMAKNNYLTPQARPANESNALPCILLAIGWENQPLWQTEI